MRTRFVVGTIRPERSRHDMGDAAIRALASDLADPAVLREVNFKIIGLVIAAEVAESGSEIVPMLREMVRKCSIRGEISEAVEQAVIEYTQSWEDA